MTRLFFAAIAALSLSFSSAEAFQVGKPAFIPKSNKSYQAVLKKARAHFSAMEAPVLRFTPSPNANPETGQAYSVFITPGTTYKNANILLSAKIDGVDVGLFRSTENLWIFQGGPYSQLRSHTLSVDIAVENSTLANEIRNSVAKISEEIDDLVRRIALETDPLKKQELTAKKNEKESIRNQLYLELQNLKKVLATQTFAFNVVAATSGEDYPRITGISPNLGETSGGTAVTITGENFAADAVVNIGGLPATDIAVVDRNTITANSPAFAPGNDGPKDVEIVLPPLPGQTEARNAIFLNGFFTAAASSPEETNYRPVAVTGAQQVVNVGEVVTLSGSNSYDSNNDSYAFTWTFRAVPAGSQHTAGEVLSTGPEANPSFTPDAPGYFALELKTKELNTTELLESEPSLAIVQVNGEENSAPIPTVVPLITSKNEVITAMVVPNDADVGQNFTYDVISQPANGTVNLVEDQLTYTPNSDFVGNDSLTIRVTDDGTPALYGDVVVPVSVLASKLTVADIWHNVRARDGLIQVEMGADTITTSSGTLVAGNWEFGDGTSERAIDLSPGEGGYVNHDYLTTGTYTVTLTVTDSNGLVSSASHEITLTNTDMPVVRVTANAISGALPLTVQFDASQSTDAEGITRFNWRWGDGNSENTTVSTNSHTFTQAGMYQVRVRALDAESNLTQGFVDIYAGIDPPAEGSRPYGAMTIASKEVSLGNAHEFDGTSSFDPNPSGSITDYHWNFSDWASCGGDAPEPGCGSTGAVASHAYTEVGQYGVTLDVTGALGAVSPAYSTYKEVLAVNSGHAPRAVINEATYNGFSGVAPYTLEADGYSSFDYEGPIAGWHWIFCDANAEDNCESINQTAVHTFTEPGEYDISLEVTDSDGNRHTDYSHVSVQASKKALEKIDKGTRTFQHDHERAQRKQFLQGACMHRQGASCFELGKMYGEEQNDAAKLMLFEKACGLGIKAACPAKKSKF
jgi:PKD repeat protein